MGGGERIGAVLGYSFVYIGCLQFSEKITGTLRQEKRSPSVPTTTTTTTRALRDDAAKTPPKIAPREI